MDPYGLLFRRVLLPLWETGIQHRPTLSILAELQRTQWYSRQKLLDMQRDGLVRLLKHAEANVPYYRDQFAAHGVNASEIRDLRDLARLPVLTRSLAQQAAERRCSVIPPLPLIRKSTSGTLGQPLRFGYDLDSEYWRQ